MDSSVVFHASLTHESVWHWPESFSLANEHINHLTQHRRSTTDLSCYRLITHMCTNSHWHIEDRRQTMSIFRSRIADEWKVGWELGAGSFGKVFSARDRRGNAVVVKTESERAYTLRVEHSVYRAVGHQTGFSKIFFYGVHEHQRVLVMQRLNRTVRSICHSMGGTLSKKDMLLVGIQAIQRLRTLHSAGYIHGDLHADNLMISNLSSSTIYLIDFGSARRYVGRLNRHIAEVPVRGTNATLIFGSVNMVRKLTQSRKHDLESLVYVLVYLYKGTLPWFGPGRLEKSELIWQKENIGASELCSGMPNSITEIFRIVRRMTFEEKPDYSRFISLIKSSLRKIQHSERSLFDWSR